MRTESTENLKPRSQYVDEAVQLAIAGSWDEAAALNRFILENFGPDEQTQNRIGKALTELGKLDEARAAYEASLLLNPRNSVAQKNTAKLRTLLAAKEEIKGGPTKVDLNLFVEEMGKTVTTAVEGGDAELCSKVAAGDVADLAIAGDSVSVATVRGVALGLIEPKLARRLIPLIRGGNRYQAGVTSCEGTTARLIIRETYQDPRYAGKPSFPMRRKREVEFRPYAKESLLTRSAEAYDEEEDEERESGSNLDMEGLHEVEDDAEPLEFAEEEEAAESDDEEDEDE